ncbi:hypothetical protein NS104_19810, partial [Enterobacter cancerogenus]
PLTRDGGQQLGRKFQLYDMTSDKNLARWRCAYRACTSLPNQQTRFLYRDPSPKSVSIPRIFIL